jgi:hypothetical protein
MGPNEAKMQIVENVRPATRFLRRAEASEYIRTHWGIPCATRTLAKLAVIGGGPLFHKCGRLPLYASSDLDTWASSKITGKYASTSTIAA